MEECAISFKFDMLFQNELCVNSLLSDQVTIRKLDMCGRELP